jgi:hypothetical protein
MNAMNTFSPEAQQLFDRYLTSVRWSVRGVAGADEIEHNVREHVASALEAADEPVSSHMLRDVLAKLGDPWQWIPADELPWWRRVMMRLSFGPDDWRLAYVCFASTVLGALLLPIGVGVIFLIAAYLLSRATYDLATENGSALGARRWLIYPPLVAVGLIALGFFLIGPAAAGVAWGVGDAGYRSALDLPRFIGSRDADIRWGIGAGAITFGAWWLIASALGALFIKQLRWLVVPLANRLRRIHFVWLAAIGAIAIVGGVLLAS